MTDSALKEQIQKNISKVAANYENNHKASTKLVIANRKQGAITSELEVFSITAAKQA